MKHSRRPITSVIIAYPYACVKIILAYLYAFVLTSRMVNRQRMREAAAAFGKEGGEKRAKNMTAQERRDGARKAAKARWAKEREKTKALREGADALLKKAKAADKRSRN